MKKKVEEVEVATATDGFIEIIQPTGGPDGTEMVVRISPDQVEILIKWLQEAREELQPAP